jgi:hypothetical protein
MQNLSTAVMQQRHEPSDSLDMFPTQPWATRALCEYLRNEFGPLDGLSCWEPACGMGDMARPLAEYFGSVRASDVHNWGFGERQDFLFPDETPCDWIITNPPFRLAEQFIHASLPRARVGVAMLVRLAFLEGVGRYQGLFRSRRPCRILQFTERVPMVKGRLTATGSTATAYCWVVWQGGASRTIFDWIPPCRRKLERAGDYEGAAA